MNVKELIDKLKELPGDMEIMTGCSCSGHELEDVVVKSHFKRVYNKNDFKGEVIDQGEKVWLI